MFFCLRSFVFHDYKRKMDSLFVLQVSTHDSTKGQILVWKYPRMTRLATFASHSSEVYYIAASPAGEAIATGGGDENLRLCHVFSEAHSNKVSAQFCSVGEICSNG
jgi:WD40 repeat protein